MQRIRILLVGRSFYPRISPRSFRVTELAKEFARQGHDVTVYAVIEDCNYSDFARQHGINVKNLGPLRFKEIALYGNKLILLIRRALRRILLMLFEYPDIELMFKIYDTLRNESGYDLMISFAAPHAVHWGCARAVANNKALSKAWIADCGDPYMGNRLDTFRKAFYFKYAEKFFCRKADYLTITKEAMKVNYYPEFRNKIRVIPQGFNYGDIRLFEGKIDNKVPTFAYAGYFIKGSRDPRKFLDYLSLLSVDFRFVIYTENQELILPYLKRLGKKLRVLPYIPREDLLYSLSQMDFLVNFEYDPATQSPSKLIDYALTGRPILSLSSLNFRKSHIDEFLKGDYRNQFIVDNIDQYNIKNVSEKFLMLYSDKIYDKCAES